MILWGRSMRGKIVIYFPEVGTGAIQIADGEQYIFTQIDSDSLGVGITPGQAVSFEPGERIAKNIAMAEVIRICK